MTDTQYELKLPGYEGTRTPAPEPAPAPPIEDDGYLIGNQAQADEVTKINSLPKDTVQSLMRDTRRRMVLSIA